MKIVVELCRSSSHEPNSGRLPNFTKHELKLDYKSGFIASIKT